MIDPNFKNCVFRSFNISKYVLYFVKETDENMNEYQNFKFRLPKKICYKIYYLASSVHNNLVKSSACMTRVLVFSCWDLVAPESTDEEDIGEETTAPAIT